MSDKFDLNAIQNALGHVFRDSTLIKTAFTHPSAVSNGEESNTKLVFLGQRLLDLMITDHICRDQASADTRALSKRLEMCCDSLEYQKYLSEHALTDCIILSELSEALRNSPPIHGQIFLAILAAIYRDGGMPSLKSFLLPMIRVADGSAKYSPKPVTTSEAEAVSPSKTKINEKDGNEKPKKGLRISVSEAVKFFTKSKKTEKKEEQKAPEKKPEAPVIDTPERKPFIRDALKPVTLPENMKTQPPKKEKTEKKSPVKTTESKPTPDTDSNNYKSMLQEFVQKNMHSASVLLKYTTTTPSKGKSLTEVTLDGNKLADGEGNNKKASEREAAKSAYLAITNKKSKLYKWFTSLNGGSASETDPVKEDYVSKLNRHYQKLSHTSSAPLTYEKRPSEKKSYFKIAILANGEEIGVGSGKSLRDAKQSAAESACAKLGI